MSTHKRDDVPTTLYDHATTRAYLRLFEPESTFNWLSAILEDQVIRLLPSSPTIAILDLACGIGSLCRRLARAGYRDVTGADCARSQIDAARAFANDASVTFTEADARDLGERASFRGRFDVVNASWLYDTACDYDDAVIMARSAHACLRSGGRHQGMELHPAIRASQVDELSRFGIALMPDELPGTRPVSGQRIRADIETGPGDPARSAVLTTKVTYFDEITLRGILAEAGFTQIEFHEPNQWDFPAALPARLREKFDDYVRTNPEMISFSASK